MTDLVERLRKPELVADVLEVMWEAADEIERLRGHLEHREKEIARLERECENWSEMRDVDIVGMRIETKQLRVAAERDAKRIGELEFALNNIAHDTIDSGLEPDEYALVVLRDHEQARKK